MALIHEDGTGKADAESYVSLVRAVAVAVLLNLTEVWVVSSDNEQEGLLREATTFLDGHYDWRGDILSPRIQALGWPRIGVEDNQGRLIANDAVPLAIEKATVFLAVQGLSSRLESVRSGAAVKSFKVGPIERVYAGGNTGQRLYTEVDTLLWGLYDGSGQGTTSGMVDLLRA